MSLGEIFSKAAMNTLLGMGTVFAVLILIIFIISLFKFIGPKQVKRAAEAAAPVPALAVEEEEDEIDDYELVAVITAAIAAATGSSTDRFVVRSIKRANNAKWRRA